MCTMIYVKNFILSYRKPPRKVINERFPSGTANQLQNFHQIELPIPLHGNLASTFNDDGLFKPAKFCSQIQENNKLISTDEKRGLDRSVEENQMLSSQIVVKPVINVFLNNCISKTKTNFALSPTNPNSSEPNDVNYNSDYSEYYYGTDIDH